MWSAVLISQFIVASSISGIPGCQLDLFSHIANRVKAITKIQPVQNPPAPKGPDWKQIKKLLKENSENKTAGGDSFEMSPEMRNLLSRIDEHLELLEFKKGHLPPPKDIMNRYTKLMDAAEKEFQSAKGPTAAEDRDLVKDSFDRYRRAINFFKEINYIPADFKTN